MKPPFPFFGAKTGMAPLIVSLMVPHRIYVEPFFGSGAVLFAKPTAVHEIVGDASGAIVAFFRCLRDRPDDLVRVCRLTPYARDEFDACELEDATDVDDLELARRLWVRVTQGFGAVTRSSTGWSRTTAGDAGNSKPVRVQATIERFAGLARRLAQCSIEHCDAVDLITSCATTSDTVVYADPPYPRDVRSHAHDDYPVDMLDDDQHHRLAVALHATPATVLLSGYHCPLYDTLFADWDHLDVPRSSHTARDRTSYVERIEVLWSNRPLTVTVRLF